MARPSPLQEVLHDTVAHRSTVSPRFGIAYAVAHRTVIRGGLGMFYARPQGNLIFSQLNLPPITQISQLENANLGNLGGGGN